MNCVLIVEDDSDINNFINDYFVIKGYSTIQAFSGTEGLLRLKNERDICCVILDLMLPGISGEEIIQEIRKVSDVPIITVSAKNEEEAKIEVLKLGADDFLLKPFNLEELQLKVERNIQKYLNLSDVLSSFFFTTNTFQVTNKTRFFYFFFNDSIVGNSFVIHKKILS